MAICHLLVARASTLQVCRVAMPWLVQVASLLVGASTSETNAVFGPIDQCAAGSA